MQLTNEINPTKAQIEELQNYLADTPVAMLNLVKYKAKTESGEESGKAAYARYSKNVVPMLQAVGGKVLYMGTVAQTFIGDTDDQPDLVLLVQYPNVQAFFSMITNPTYLEISKDRKIALEYGGLWATTPMF